jgi:hypothetical protein
MTAAGQVGTACSAEAPDPGAVSATSAGRRRSQLDAALDLINCIGRSARPAMQHVAR